VTEDGPVDRMGGDGDARVGEAAIEGLNGWDSGGSVWGVDVSGGCKGDDAGRVLSIMMMM
jgi:hypothetical protein